MFFRAPKTQNLVIWQLGPARKTGTNYTDQNPPPRNSINKNNTQTNSLSLSLSKPWKVHSTLHNRRHVSKQRQAQNFKRGWRCNLRERAVKHPNTHPPIFFCNPPKLLLLLLLAAWRKLPTNSNKNTRTHTRFLHRETHKNIQDFFAQEHTQTDKISFKKHKIDKTNNQIIQFLGSKISKTIWETYQKQIKAANY